MSEYESEAVEGVEMQPGDVQADDEPAELTDEERLAQENAEHERFLETYQPVITRLPEALIVEAEARAEELKAERVQVLVRDLGISEDEARVQVYGPTVVAESDTSHGDAPE